MSSDTTHIKGTVQSFNISPKGSFEGLLLASDGETIQINFPREWSATVVETTPLGAAIDVQVERRPDPNPQAAHLVYQIVSLNDRRFSGTVRQLNYSLGGEVNGAILDSGDFLHLKPHGAAALKLIVGMRLEGTGSAKPMMGGAHVIEAEEVNGLRLEAKPKPKPKKKLAHA